MISRRKVIASAVGVSAAVALTACTPEVSDLTNESQTPEATESAVAEPIEVCKTTDIPVGSGKTFQLENIAVLITQPKAGEFRAFNAACTHAGYVIQTVNNSQIRCDNHGAEFDSDTGAVLKGPAGRALGKITVEVQGDSVLVSF